MFVTSQVWQKDADYKRLIKNLDPPPAPGDDSVWELHFCKWWGWNWVKRMEAEAKEETVRRSLAPDPVETKKPQKKPVKHLCRTLCFKKKNKNQEPLQEMYNTPSNSVIDNPNRNSLKPDKDVTESNIKYKQDRTDSVIQREVEEQISREVRAELYAKQEKDLKKPTPQTKTNKTQKEWSTYSSDEYCCPCKIDKNGSSTDESMEYIKIQCCPCCHSREPPPVTKKYERSTATQELRTQPRIMATQTEEVAQKKRKRKKICVICCCNCKQNKPPPCCLCYKNNNEEYAEKTRTSNRNAEPVFKPKHEEEYITYNATVEHSPTVKDTKKGGSKPPSHVDRRFEPLYVTGMPIDTMLYYNKLVPRFAIPAGYQSSIHATKSDVWDHFSNFRVNEEFSSPVSGKTYNIAPIKLDLNPEPEPSVLFEPLSVDEELRSLKKIQTDIKMDLKSRIMLDAVCDAILAEDKDPNRSSSVFLNEFTYPTNVNAGTEPNNSEPVRTYSKLNQTSLERIIFGDSTNKVNETKVSCETNTSRLNLDLHSTENGYLHHDLMVQVPQITNRRFYDNYNLPRRYVRLNENNNPYKLTDYSFRNKPPLFTIRNQAAFASTKLQTSKRSASPTTQFHDVKKVKVQESSTLTSTKVSDIFKRIDEIVMRSKVNNAEVQSVLGSIPKRTLQFYTSWEVAGSNQHFPVQVREERSASTSVQVGANEEARQKPKVKAPTQIKKKKVGPRPSLIPKRVTNFKLDKKM